MTVIVTQEARRRRVANATARGGHVPPELRELLADLTDPDECWFDHHGYCQAHGWMQTDPPCPHARAKQLA